MVEIARTLLWEPEARSVLNKLAERQRKADAVANYYKRFKIGQPLVNKINVLKTLRWSRPGASRLMESAKYVIRCLPPKIAEMLFKGGATINLAQYGGQMARLFDKRRSLPDVYLRMSRSYLRV
ncbi:MAG: hypothetical protein R3D26_24950 [Cyanobacteriota/Melainabacteria group bacterium]